MQDNSNTNPKWAELLREAVEKPGTISTAYSAFHNYSTGNQMLALCQCHARGMAESPSLTVERQNAIEPGATSE